MVKAQHPHRGMHSMRAALALALAVLCCSQHGAHAQGTPAAAASPSPTLPQASPPSAQPDAATAALLAFRAAITPTSWAAASLNGWSDSPPGPCAPNASQSDWDGVGCSPTGQITSLRLVSRGLNGTLSASLSALSALTSLQLASNSLRGQLPPSFSALSDLQDLNLAKNALTGVLPILWSVLGQLTGFDVSRNALRGALPVQYSALTNLQELAVGNNRLTGVMPGWQYYSALSGLTRLDVAATGLTGEIPPVASPYNVSSIVAALLHLKASMTPESWAAARLNGWTLGSRAPCDPQSQWSLVDCDFNGLVTLRMSSLNLVGTLTPELSRLTALRELIMWNNRINGTLPAEFSVLTNLEYIDFDNNRLSGSFPSAWSSLNSLTYISMVNQQLTGTLPSAWSELKGLSALDAATNSLNGSIPVQWSRMTALSRLNLAGNLLTGNVPSYSQWSGMTALTNLDISMTYVRGSVEQYYPYQIPTLVNALLDIRRSMTPSSWAAANLTTLAWAYNGSSPCTRNQQWQGLQCRFADPVELQGTVVGISLPNLGLSGVLPASLSILQALTGLDFSGNNLYGALPAEYSRLTAMIRIDLSNNTLTGTAPAAWGVPTRLTSLDLSHNLLGGTLPPRWSSLTNLFELRLNDNQFEGGLYPWGPWSTMQRLTYLSAQNNSLLPPLPPQDQPFALQPMLAALLDIKAAFSPDSQASLPLSTWTATNTLPCSVWQGVLCDGSNLTGIALQSQGLVGTLPASVSYLTQLEYLALNGNNISGPLPPSWGELSRLTYLNLGLNGLNATLPPAWSRLSRLTLLYLTGNRLTGPLPPSWSSIPLVALNLDGNALTGALPGAWSGMAGMTSLTLSNNRLNGTLPSSWEVLRQLVFLDLHNNQLSGGLTATWSRLSRLSLLALGNNSLQGTLPTQWSTLGVPSDSTARGLGTLRLERNQLTGPLPPAWSSLTLLSRIELGGNRLNGTLPHQWSTLGPSTWRPLNYLNVSGNALIGPLPVAWSALTAISSLDLQGNRITGSLPALWSRLVTVTYLDLSGNSVNGTLPQSWSALQQLTNLDLSRNRLTGLLPAQWSALANNLAALRLQGNGNSWGPTPQEWSTLLPVLSIDGQSPSPPPSSPPPPPQPPSAPPPPPPPAPPPSASPTQTSPPSVSPSLSSAPPPPAALPGGPPPPPPSPSAVLGNPSPQGSTGSRSTDTDSSSSSMGAIVGGVVGGVGALLLALAVAWWWRRKRAPTYRSPLDPPPAPALSPKTFDLPPPAEAVIVDPGNVTLTLSLGKDPDASKDAVTASAVTAAAATFAGDGQSIHDSVQTEDIRRGDWRATYNTSGTKGTSGADSQALTPLQLSDVREGSRGGLTNASSVSTALTASTAAGSSQGLVLGGSGVSSSAASTLAQPTPGSHSSATTGSSGTPLLAGPGAGAGRQIQSPFIMPSPWLAGGAAAFAGSIPSLAISDPSADAAHAGGLGAGLGLGLGATSSSMASRVSADAARASKARSIPELLPREDVHLELQWEKDIVLLPEAKLGKGGQGQVWKGLFRDKEVAIKLINDDDESSLLDLQTELQFLARLNHENVVRVLGGCMRPPNLCVVQELMAGDLSSRIHKSKDEPLDLPTVLCLAMDIARGLVYLHGLNIIHRDLKPGNVLIDQQGVAKIADFGLARHKNKTFLSTKRPEAGTVVYQAPECFNDELGGISTKADVFSVGVILWEMLVRKPPWGHLEYPGQIIYQVSLKNNRPPLPPASDQCPQALLDIISWSWFKHPQLRPTAVQIYDALSELADVGGDLGNEGIASRGLAEAESAAAYMVELASPTGAKGLTVISEAEPAV